jgi:AraC-like DNA-binding protein
MNPTREISIMGKLIAGINFFVMIFYSVLTVRLVNIHKIRIQEYLSNITNQETLTWLYWVIASFYGTLFLTVTITILTRLTQVGILEIQITLTGFNIMFWSIFTFLAYCMSFFFLRQGPIFPGLLTGSEEKDNSDRGRDPQSLGEKYKKSGLSEATKQDIYDRLHRLIKEEKPYLDEELNLKKLSESLGVSVNHLSQVINEMENQSFYYFVNQCRSREAMRLIEGDPNQGKKLIEIAYESGFNSLSSFNLHFKRVTGMTPREFRNLCSNKKSESPV